MTTLQFTITFHTWFRVGAAHARDGLDAAVDYTDVLPADHLKGLMRAAARDVLHLSPARVAEVFGGSGPLGDPSGPCPWAWTSATPSGPWTFETRHRVHIDSDTHAATKDQLVVGEQARAPSALFEVRLEGLLDPQALPRHLLVLRTCGAAVTGLGAWRRRGLGWVTIRPEQPITDADVTALFATRDRDTAPQVADAGPITVTVTVTQDGAE